MPPSPRFTNEKQPAVTKANIILTGISGLDDIFLGGIPQSNTILIQGAAGTGKTLWGVQLVYQGIIQHAEPGIIVMFETNPDKLIRDAGHLGWDLHDLQKQNKLKIIFTSPQVFEAELRSPNSLLLETAAEMGAKRIYIDGIGLLSPAPANGSRPL